MEIVKKLKTVMIEITDKCNLNCRHCMNRQDFSNIEISLEQYTFILHKICEYGVEKIFISGGEPLLHNNILDIITMCKLYPEVIFVITTNGLLLSDNLMREIENQNNLTLQFSVDGCSKHTYEAIRGINTYDIFIDKIRIWKNSKIKQGLARTCINANNVKEIGNIYEFCLQNKLTPSFLFVESLGNGKDNWNELNISLAEKIWCIGEINRLNTKYNYSIAPPEAPATCNFTEGEGVCSLLVRAGGRVAPCQFFYNDSIGNIFIDSIHDILTHKWLEEHREIATKRKKILANTPKCQSCKIKEGCNFGCVGKANELGNILLYDGLCELRELTAICYSNQLITFNKNAQKANSILLDLGEG